MIKIIHVLHLILMNLFYLILRIWMYVMFKTEKTKKASNKIALLPYTPKNWYGGDIRIANWKPYLEKKGYEVDVVWAWSKEEMHLFDEKGWIKKYKIYSRILMRRFLFFFKIFNYDFLWIQRAYIPQYPFKKSMFEKLLKLSKIPWMIDFYDPDYRHNPNYVNQAAKYATKVSVVNKYLKDYFISIGCKKVFVINLTIDEDRYVVKKKYDFMENVIIGWMGSKSNFYEVDRIKDSLRKIQDKYPKVKFVFICNDKVSISGLNMEIVKWDEVSFYDLISRFDIGIVPISYKENEWLKGKVAMKSVEMMASGLPIICSPFGVSNHLIHEVNALFSDNVNEWFENIERLISDKKLREFLGKNARIEFLKEHVYESQLNKIFDCIN